MKAAKLALYIVLGPVLIYALFLCVSLVVGITAELWADVGALALIVPAGIVSFAWLLSKGRL